MMGQCRASVRDSVPAFDHRTFFNLACVSVTSSVQPEVCQFQEQPDPLHQGRPPWTKKDLDVQH